MQLLRIDWNVVFTIINLIVLYLGLRKFLIGPVTNVMEQRKQMIEGQIADANNLKAEAGVYNPEASLRIIPARSIS